MSEIESEPVKIKVQKRTPSERQIEALERARKAKLTKKLIKDAMPPPSDDFFLKPSRYLILTGTAAGLGLAVYYYLSSQKSSEYMHISSGIPVQVPKQDPLPQPQNIQKSVPSKEDIFLGNSIRI